MNNRKKELITKVNLNIYSCILSGGQKHLHVVEKIKNNVLVPPGGSSLWGNMKSFCEEEKSRIFSDTIFNYFNNKNECLYDISEDYILYLYKEILSSEIKNSHSKFNAMIESLEETGKLFFRNLKLLHYEKVGDHEKFFYKGEEYIFFSVVGRGHMEYVLMVQDQVDGHPINGRDFLCHDSDLSRTYVKLKIRDLLESYQEDSSLFKRYGAGGHTIALIKFIDSSSFLKDEENKDLIFIFEKLKRKFI